MTATGILGGALGYDPSPLPSKDESLQPEREAAKATAVAPPSAGAARAADAYAQSSTESAELDPRHTVTYGRRALATPAASVGHRLDVTG